MPYRIDLRNPSADTFDRLVDLGALDVELDADGAMAALLPDRVSHEQVVTALGRADFQRSPALGRDDGSVWILRAHPFRVGALTIAPADAGSAPDTIRLIDAPAFGTGLHPTTTLCLEALASIIDGEVPESVLDVGTGSGILALAALTLGVRHVTAIDIDDAALQTAAENAALNGLTGRLTLAAGDADSVTGRWPLVLGNVLAAPLIEMAPTLSRRVDHRGLLVLSGIPVSIEPEVTRVYQRLGTHRTEVRTRAGWAAVVLRASW